MYKCAVEKNSVYQELTGNENQWQIISVTGLNPPGATINISSVVGLDGGRFNSSKLDTRNIVIMLKINGDVEKNRLFLYSLFRTKEEVRFYYSNESREVYIDGRVETVECAYFEKMEILQISIICPQPYFRALEEIITDISKVIPRFEFPFSIEADAPEIISEFDTSLVTDIVNEGESETGVIIEITFLSAVATVTIQNTETGEYFTLNYRFWEDDVVTINTNRGKKSVTLTRAGMNFNIFSAIDRGSTFFELVAGDNFFSYTADAGAGDENINIVFRHDTVYRGV